MTRFTITLSENCKAILVSMAIVAIASYSAAALVFIQGI
jgi:hypothetical protein